MEKRNVKICVVGAGAAGLAAAGKLLESGFQVTVLEAADRFGGRILSKKIGGKDVDLGAHWVGGEPIYSLGSEAGLLKNTQFLPNLHFVFDDGHVVAGSKSKELWSKINEFSSDTAALRAFKWNLGDYYTERFNKCGDSLGLDAQMLEGFISWVHKLECFIYGPSDLHEASPATCTQRSPQTCCSLWKSDGFNSLIDLLLAKISKFTPNIDDNCKLNCEVLNINYEGDKVIVSTSGSKSFVFDHVIVTVPLAVLKEKHQSLFCPGLPEINTEALKSLDMGVVDKIYLEYQSRWWPENFSGFGFTGSEKSSEWEKSIMGVFTVDGAPLILYCLVCGDAAINMEKHSESEVMESVTRSLRFHLKNDAIPKPISILRSTWFSNPHIRGSCSYYKANSSDLYSQQKLSTPVCNHLKKKVLFFAGEATSTGNFSTAHGAVESGFREADRIISIYSNIQSSHAKIVIVGAGLAGLAAAKLLIENGVTDILILEAQKSAGGRLITKRMGEGLIELGAQWAHASGSRMYDFASDCGLISSVESSEGSGTYFYPNGKRVTRLLVEEIRNVVLDILNRCIIFNNTNHKGRIPATVAEFLYSEFEKYLESCNDNEDVIQIKRDLYEWNVRFEVIDNSCKALSDLSARLWGQYGDEDFVQDHISIAGGFSSLVESLVRTLPQGVLLTSCPVSKIEWNDDSRVEEPVQSPCKLICEDGRTFTANHVIVTSSIGFLQQNLNIFQPPLPPKYQVAIKSLGFGTINKIFLFYDDVWWQEIQGIQLLWGDKSQYDFVTHSMKWVTSMTGFDPVPTMDNVLVGWVGGDGAVDSERLTDEEIALHCTAVFRNFTGLPVPNPTGIIRSRWNSNKYVCGAYSHLTPDCESCFPQPQVTLLNPLTRLWGQQEMVS